MKLFIALLAALLLGALPLLTSSNYIVGVGISALLFTVAAAALTVVTFGGTFWMGLVYAALLNGVLALIIGYPILRTNRHAFVISTLTFALLAALIARDWVSLTRGPLGIPNLPSPQAFGVVFETTHQFYWIAWAFSVAMIAFLYALCSSRIGRTLVAIKQNEPLVRAQGISPMPYKLASFAISAAITGAAGGVFTFDLRIIDPSFLDFYYMQTFLIIVIIGGAGSFWAVIASGIALSALPEVLRFSADFRMIIYGVILVAAMFIMPSGVAGWLRQREIARMREVIR